MAEWERQRSIGKWGGRQKGSTNLNKALKSIIKEVEKAGNVGSGKGLMEIAPLYVD